MTADALREYEKLVKRFIAFPDVAADQMFGKPCIKVNGKAFIALHNEWVVFKLDDPVHGKAMFCTGARLWDPSGKSRPMKEWVALPAAARQTFSKFRTASFNYVLGLSK